MVIKDVMPSDGGLYSCMAVSGNAGNASRDVAIHSKSPYFSSSIIMCRWTSKPVEMCLTLFCVFFTCSTTGHASLCGNLTWPSLSSPFAQKSAN